MSERPTSTVQLNWEGGFKFTSADAHGHTIEVDAPQVDGGEFDGFKPGELLLTALAGCSGIDVANILTRQRQEVTGLEIRVKGTQDPDPPWTWVQVELEYTIRGKNLRPKQVKRAIDLSENKYCSVGATIAGNSTIKSSFTIIDEGDRSPTE